MEQPKINTEDKGPDLSNLFDDMALKHNQHIQGIRKN